MYGLERQQQIILQLKARGRVSVADLAALFDTSAETIRRDLAVLEEAGSLRRVHGGAVDIARINGPEPTMQDRAQLRTEEKRRIAAQALPFIEGCASVFLESASTSMALAEILPARSGLTVVTNGLSIAHHLALRGDVDVVMVGGRVRTRSLATLDDWVHSNLAGLHVDVAFLGTLAISVDAGLTTPDTTDAIIKSKCLALAEKNILLAESAKFGAVSMCRYGEFSDLDVIISDTSMSDIQADEIKALGVNVILA